MSSLCKNAVKDHIDAVLGLAQGPKSGEGVILVMLISCNADMAVRIWKQSSDGYFVSKTLKDHTDAVLGLIWRPESGEGAILAMLESCCVDTMVQILQQSSCFACKLEDKNAFLILKDHMDAVLRLAWRPKSGEEAIHAMLASGSAVQIWQQSSPSYFDCKSNSLCSWYKIPDLELVQTLKDHIDVAVGLARNAKYGEGAIPATLASCCADTTVRIWQQISTCFLACKVTNCLERSPASSYQKQLQVFVKNVSGESMIMWVKKTDSIRQLKEMIYERQMFYPPIVLYQSRQLYDSLTVGYYNIVQDSIIVVTGCLKGSGNWWSIRNTVWNIFQRSVEESDIPSKCLDDYKREVNWVTYEQLETVTNHFNVVMGRGGQGVVYRGSSESGQQLAVKEVRNPNPQTKRTPKLNRLFMKEIDIYLDPTYRHENIMEILGFHVIGESFDVVYIMMPLMEKGDLHGMLQTEQQMDFMTFRQRLKIMLGVVRAIDFLHSREKSLLFRDLKPHNVLLDRDYNPRLADFGSSAFGSADGKILASEIKDNELVGTRGYIDKYYVLNRRDYRPTSDVYQIGLLLYELLHGENNSVCTHGGTNVDLIEYVDEIVIHGGAIFDVKDPNLGQLSAEEEYVFALVMNLGLQCIEKDPKKRPTAAEVLVELQVIQNKLNPDEAGPSDNIEDF